MPRRPVNVKAIRGASFAHMPLSGKVFGFVYRVFGATKIRVDRRGVEEQYPESVLKV
jgi:hypothetical protein